MAKRLTENSCLNLAAKLGNYTTNPPRLSDLKAALYGKQGRVTDEIKYLGRSKAKLSDAWVSLARSKNEDKEKSLTEIKNVFMMSETF